MRGQLARRVGRGIACAGLVAGGLAHAAEDDDTAFWRAQGTAALERAKQVAGRSGRARSVVLFVGDGMGMATVTATRILDGQARGGRGEEHVLPFERFPYVALLKTYNTDLQVSESAGTMTAMVTGVKTRSGSLSVGPEVARGDVLAARAHALETLFEGAERRGFWTGFVTTTTATHATPAATYGHSPERDWETDAALSEEARAADYPDLARQLVEFRGGGDGLEVALGGGRAFFRPRGAPDPEHPAQPLAVGTRLDGRDLAGEWAAREGAAYVWSGGGLDSLDLARVRHLLGLFDPSHLRFEVERAADPGGEPSLSEMTRVALAVLRRAPHGFALVVEGGRIDHGHHGGNAYRALHEASELARAVEVALGAVDRDRTLVLVTADHSHTLTIAGYPPRGNPILGTVDPGALLPSRALAMIPEAMRRPYPTLGYANGPGYREELPDLREVDTAARDYRQPATWPLPSETHGGEDVPLYAGGAGAPLFHGVREQSYVYHAIVEALGWGESD
jgi:alkaline phosphatase